jgi:hypothetical protein
MIDSSTDVSCLRMVQHFIYYSYKTSTVTLNSVIGNVITIQQKREKYCWNKVYILIKYLRTRHVYHLQVICMILTQHFLCKELL